MDFVSWQFFMALGSIIVLDLVLAGDNAVVIALASYDLPKNIRRKVIYIGTAGAVVIRMMLTLIAVQLLTVPYLQALGGMILLPIALKLLRPKDKSLNVEAAVNFWGAVKTIIIADVAMGIDNVLAIAGAANGDFLLVFMGLIVSIPIVVSGSRFIGNCIEKHPGLIYLGAAVLAWTSGSMIMHDSITGHQIKIMTGNAADYVVPACLILIVCIVGYWCRRVGTVSMSDCEEK